MKTFTIFTFCAFIFCLCVGKAGAQHYQNYSQDFCAISHFITSGNGGGCVYVDLVNDVLTIQFSGGFTPSTLRTGKIKYLNTSPLLPDMVIGNLNQGSYTVSLEDGWLKITGSGTITGFVVTMTKNVPANTNPPPIPADLSNWLLSPNGGEVFHVGDDILVDVNTELINSTIRVYLYNGDVLVKDLGVGVSDGRIIATSDLSGSSNQYRIKISSPDGTHYDWSDSYFAIEDYSNWLLSPNGGESYVRGDTIFIDVDENVHDVGSNLAVEVYGANGVFKFYGPISLGSNNFIDTYDGSNTFISGDQHLLKIFDMSDPTIEDWSNGTFSHQLESVQLISAIGGTVNQTSDHELSWEIQGTYEYYELNLVKSGEQDIKIIENGVSGNSFLWKIPDSVPPGTLYRLELNVYFSGGRLKSSLSNYFSVQPHPLRNWLLTPSAGQVFTVHDNIPIVVDTDLYNPGGMNIELYKQLRSVVTSKKLQMGPVKELMASLIERGVVEAVDPALVRFYLPWTIVQSTKMNGQLKTRMVVDGSLRPKGTPSLNDTLLVPPDDQSPCLEVMTRARLFKMIAFGDISEAFFSLKCSFADSLFHAILIPPTFDAAGAGAATAYRMVSYPMGLASSPSAMAMALQFILQKATADGVISESLRNRASRSIYVDDTIVGITAFEEAESLEKALRQYNMFYKEPIRVLPSGAEEMIPILGHLWDQSKDRIYLKPVNPQLAAHSGRLSLRRAAAYPAAAYDVLGFLTSVVALRTRKIYQEILALGIQSWSSAVPEEKAL
ncbi:MAG: hypothetical protein AAF693_20845, partial [Bacteroidota bacterium]